MTFEMNSPPVGWPIQYFPNDNHDHPLPAQVAEQGEEGQVKLIFHYSSGGNSVSSKGFVRHVSDPWVQRRAEIVRRNGQGTWGYVPGLEYKGESPAKKPAPKQQKQLANA